MTATTTRQLGWLDHAACRHANPDLFSPGHSARSTARRTANRYCAHCPVTAECAEHATRHHCTGLWAGSWRVVRGGRNHIKITPLIGAGR